MSSRVFFGDFDTSGKFLEADQVGSVSVPPAVDSRISDATAGTIIPGTLHERTDDSSEVSSQKRTFSLLNDQEYSSPNRESRLRARASLGLSEGVSGHESPTQPSTRASVRFGSASLADTSTGTTGTSRLNLVSRKRALVSQTRPAWSKKQPFLALGNFCMNGISHRVERIGDGAFHAVFKFLDEGTITIATREVPLSNLVLKILARGRVGPNKEVQVILDDQKGYVHLLTEAVPVVEILINPITFIDTHMSKNGMFWLVEKMDEPVTGKEWVDCESFEALDDKSKKVLSFAKHWLSRMADEKRDIINDFRKRNTMLKDGEIKIVDYSAPENEKWEIKYMIGRYVADWANGNRVIFDWLISDFPDDMRPEFS